MKSTTRPLVITFALPMVLLAGVGIADALGLAGVEQFVMDVSSIAGLHPLSGMLSDLGILLWCASAAISLFALFSLERRNGESARFLLAAALLSLYLMFDDLFQIHERLAPDYLGVPEKLVLATLALSQLAFLVAFRRLILRTGCLFLVLALGLFALSLAADLGHFASHGAALLVEEGCKWLGIAAWCSYHVQTAHRLLLEDAASRRSSAPATAAGAEQTRQPLLAAG